MVIGLVLFSAMSMLFLTPLHAVLSANQASVSTPTPTPVPFVPTPPLPLPAVLTPKGAPGHFIADAAILIDADSGDILYDRNGESPMAMASTTKIMTALIAIQTGNLDQPVLVGQDAWNEVNLNGGSGANLVVNDRLTLHDLLYALMLPSGDDAAVAIADAVGGSVPNFVQMMNREALRLHLYQTHFANPDGLEVLNRQGTPLNGVHYTTAYDLVRLAQYAMHLPLFAQIVQTPVYDVPATGVHTSYHWKNINALLSTYKGTLGIKTGWTPQAGGCLAFAVKQDGHTLIGVVLHSADEASRFKDAEKLLNWGFSLPMQIPQR
jgi:D-alanyl-D-alanine carboxypeptidase (penicillin-binding protein 5/6)